MLGHQKQDALAQLYTHAGAFVLPSSHEGQPLAVIEALGYGCPVVLSDIPAHREIGIASATYFRAGDVDELTGRLADVFRNPPARNLVDREGVLRRHDWRSIAHRTLDVYRAALRESENTGAAGDAKRSD